MQFKITKNMIKHHDWRRVIEEFKSVKIRRELVFISNLNE